MMRARRDVDMTGFNRFVMAASDTVIGHCRFESFGKSRRELRRHMLGNERRRAIGGQSHQQRLERLDSAGRCADKNDLFLRRGGRCGRGFCGAAAMPRGRRRGRWRRLSPSSAVPRQDRPSHGKITARLGYEVDCADFERFERRLGTALGQRGNHDHRHGPQRHDFAQERQPVHMRHLDIKRHHVGIERLDALARDMRVARQCRPPRFRDRPKASSTAIAASPRNRRRSKRELARFDCVIQSSRTARSRRQASVSTAGAA